MKKTANIITFVSLALAASVTYNVVQHQRAKGIRPDRAQPGSASGSEAAANAERTEVNVPKAGGFSLTFQSARYDAYGNDIEVEFHTDSPINAKSAEIRIEPKLDKVSVSTYRNELTIHGDFAPSTKYRVRIKKGLNAGDGGEEMMSDAVFDIQTPDLSSDLKFLSSGEYYPILKDKIELPYRAQNVKKVSAELYRAYDNNLGLNFGYEYGTESTMEKVGEKEIDLTNDAFNTKVNHMFDAGEMMKDRKPGLYKLVLSFACKDRYSDYDRSYPISRSCTFTLTDFAVSAASSSKAKDGLTVFVRRISDAKPVADAELVIVSRKNQTAAKGKTGANGMAVLKFAPAFKVENDDIQYISIRKGVEFGWFPILGGCSSFESDKPTAFAFAERGVLRPGETFTASAYIRETEDKGMLPLKNAPVTLTVSAPNGKEFFTQNLKTDDAGFVSAQIKLPDTAATGSYWFQFGLGKQVWGGNSIQAASYTADRIKTKIDRIPFKKNGNKTDVNSPIQYNLSADYYFGTPVPSARANINYFCSSNGKRPAHWKEWSVGDSSKFNFDDYDTTSTVIDGKLNFTLPGFLSRGISFSPINVSVSASVQEAGGRSVSTSDNFTIYPTDWFLGLKKGESTEQECIVDLAGLTPEAGTDLKLDTDRTVKFTVYKGEWDYVLTDDSEGFFRRWKKIISEVKGAGQTIVIPKGSNIAEFKKQIKFSLPNGCYTIVAESGTDIRTAAEIWHYAGEAGVRSGNPSELMFKTDADRYEPGKTAKIKFNSPAAGEAFVAMGGTSLEKAFAMPVKAGENTIEAPIPANCLSGGYIVRTIVVCKMGKEYMKAEGTAELEVDLSASRLLKVNITVPGVVRPESEAALSVSLTDKAGNPASGRVFLFAVDSGVLSLTNFKTPDIFDQFFGTTKTWINMAESYSGLFPDLQLKADGTIGGGADSASASAALKASLVKVKETARLIAPPFDVPASGKYNLNVKLPDHAGAMRVMAVASSDRLAGSGDVELIMRNPVSLTVSAPRVLSPGDEAELAIRVFNHDAKDGAAKFTLTLPDSIQTVGELPKVDSLKPGESKDVSIRVKALDKLGPVKIAATLSVGAESRTETTYITVRPVNPPQTVISYSILKPGESITLNPAKDFSSMDSSVLRISSSPAVGVRDGLDWLNRYPYGCLEQTVSAAFPFLAADSLVKTGLLDAEIAKTMEAKVPAVYARIIPMLTADGAFSMWPGVRESWPAGTVYAAHFMFEARAEKRIVIDKTIERDVTAYLRRIANSAGNYSVEIRAYAAYVLAVAGDKNFAVPARNLLAEKTNSFATFLAAAALVRGGFAGDGAARMHEAIKDKVWAAEKTNKGNFVGLWDNASRAGMTLSILMKCDPKAAGTDAAELASFLAARIRNDGYCWGTTQSNAWACLGLAAFAEQYPPAKAAGTIKNDGKEDAFSTDQFAEKKLNPADPAVVSNTSKSAILLQHIVSGIPKQAQKTAGTITLNRAYFDIKGKPVSSLKHGDAAIVRVTVSTTDVVDNIVISDLIPAGLEIEDSSLSTRQSIKIPREIIQVQSGSASRITEKRDDRFLVFGKLYGKTEFFYTVRAVTRGKFAIPALTAEDMYNPDERGIFTDNQGVFEVK